MDSVAPPQKKNCVTPLIIADRFCTQRRNRFAFRRKLRRIIDRVNQQAWPGHIFKVFFFVKKCAFLQPAKFLVNQSGNIYGYGFPVTIQLRNYRFGFQSVCRLRAYGRFSNDNAYFSCATGNSWTSYTRPPDIIGVLCNTVCLLRKITREYRRRRRSTDKDLQNAGVRRGVDIKTIVCRKSESTACTSRRPWVSCGPTCL